MNWVLALPVLVPFVGAAISLLLPRNYRVQRVVGMSSLGIVLAASVVILWHSRLGPFVLDVGGWAAPVGISLVADRLSALMLLVSVFVTLCVMIYSSSEVFEDDRVPLSVFYPTFLILSAGVSNSFLTGDLFNLYVGFEILLVSSFVLIMLGGTRDRLRSGTVYVVVSMISSSIFLIALAMVYAATGTVNMAQLAIRLPQIDSGTAQLIQVMLLVAFGVKAAVFPLSAWLPDSYPTAPAPVTAVFAGLLTKVGIYAIIRTQTILFGDSKLNPWLLGIGLLTMIVGILGAVAQDDIKRLLSFTLVSHIGFMLWGLGTGTVDGICAAIFYTAHHIIVQTALFLVSGIMERMGGTTSLVRLGGLLKAWPLLAVLFLVPAFNLAGIPPMSGFLGKIGLIKASAQVGTPTHYLMIAGGLVSSLLTLFALARAWNMSFWQPLSDDAPPLADKITVPWVMPFATGLLVVGSLALTVFAAPLYSFTTNAAENLTQRNPYVRTVLPDYQRGSGQSQDSVDGPAPAVTATAPIKKPSASPTPSTDETRTPQPSAAPATPMQPTPKASATTTRGDE
ncbi:Na+/H+ antiporter subunit D [Propionimicrobium lymphophilum]|uniref:Na+/H+ antiporter subunit D n=1 Tax=Propionimicrobium lymphophilum TaxID=33012 RepID=UPI000400BE4A|nr:Na+/H+ antiporter subunit D [Propionimicrobium lymphophilum]